MGLVVHNKNSVPKCGQKLLCQKDNYIRMPVDLA